MFIILHFKYNLFLNKVLFLIIEFCDQNNSGNKIKGDILFLIDSSSAVGVEQFTQSVRLIHDTVKTLNENFGSNGIQVIVKF